MRRNIIDASQLELTDKVVSIKRVTKVVKGGRNMKFTALVLGGDNNGQVGVGLGKALREASASLQAFRTFVPSHSAPTINRMSSSQRSTVWQH